MVREHQRAAGDRQRRAQAVGARGAGGDCPGARGRPAAEARNADCAFLVLRGDEENDGSRRRYDSLGCAESRREIMTRTFLDGREHPSRARDRRFA